MTDGENKKKEFSNLCKKINPSPFYILLYLGVFSLIAEED